MAIFYCPRLLLSPLYFTHIIIYYRISKTKAGMIWETPPLLSQLPSKPLYWIFQRWYFLYSWKITWTTSAQYGLWGEVWDSLLFLFCCFYIVTPCLVRRNDSGYFTRTRIPVILLTPYYTFSWLILVRLGYPALPDNIFILFCDPNTKVIGNQSQSTFLFSQWNSSYQHLGKTYGDYPTFIETPLLQKRFRKQILFSHLLSCVNSISDLWPHHWIQ